MPAARLPFLASHAHCHGSPPAHSPVTAIVAVPSEYEDVR